MPELPDLEVVKDVLSPRIVGRTVRGVEVNRSGLVRTATPGIAFLVDRELGLITRRGTYLVFSFPPAAHLIVHLMRWGWLWHGPQGYTPTTSTQLRVTFDNGTDLRLIEGKPPYEAAAWVVSDLSTAAPLRGLGVEPLSGDFTLEALRRLVAGRRRPVKWILTDPSLIAGIGSVYADEILFQAKLSPVRYAHTLTADEIERLWQAVGKALRWAVAEIRSRVGENLPDRDVRDFHRVHGRKAAPCPDCGTPIAEILFDDTQTNYCPQCQGTSAPAPARAR